MNSTVALLSFVNFVFADASPNGGPLLSTANSLWLDQTWNFNPSFTRIGDNVYEAASFSVDLRIRLVLIRYSSCRGAFGNSLSIL
uniref:Serpin-ZX-like n=1 Tax=Nicotiana sylvestris TaxID=4096 RepID=A0A1U7V289_NICSY|nr:PREDICTED: serpin-ZX-like [Nicotiana sylvestris]